MMASSGKKTRKPVELSSIINVVQHNPKSTRKSSYHKMEVKSVVHVGTEKNKKSIGQKVQSRHEHKSSKTSELASEQPKLLLPFGHQVSGRASMLCYDETTILKPYVSRELFFYQNMSQELKIFTPQFRGLVTVSFVEDNAATSVLAYALPRTLVKPNAKSIIKLFAEEPKPHSKRCVRDFGKTHVIYPDRSIEQIARWDAEDTDCGMFVEPVNLAPSFSTEQDDDVVSDLSQGFGTAVCIDDSIESGKENNIEQKFSVTGLHNPWNRKVLDDAWLKLKLSDGEDPKSGKKKRFTLLENVVAHYRRPCVLDLKIGTRIRENASAEKIARHVTAINLGARLSGMQIYHPEKEQFSYHNKYYGHNLTIGGFKANLRHFFSRGKYPMSLNEKLESHRKYIDRDLVKQAVEKLRRLKDIIKSMKSHRFYSSSLLLLYEGDVSSNEKTHIPDLGHSLLSSKNQHQKKLSSDCSSPTPSQRSLPFSDLKHSTKGGTSLERSTSNTREALLTSQRNSASLKSPVKKHTIHDHFAHAYGASEHDSDSNHESRNTHGFHHIHDHHDQGSYDSSRQCHHKSSSRESRSHYKHRKSCRSRRVKSHNELSFLNMEDADGDDLHRKPQRGVYSWKSWPTRAKCLKMYAETDQNYESLRMHRNPNQSCKMECEPCLYDNGEIYDTNRHNAIDVRMIDFAHYCYQDDIMHPGSDKGFIYGLDNLIVLLNEMVKV